jgi:transcriptional regulator with XRE-family HTH domain
MALAVTTSDYVSCSNVADFRALLQRIAGAYPTHRALAKAIGVTPSRLSRAMSGSGGDVPFNIENCLKLASVSGESPSEILRAAGKGNVADLIESVYGREPEFTSKDREILEAWRALSPRAQGAMAALLDDLTPQKVKTRHKRPA